jgi:hypothetical protein
VSARQGLRFSDFAQGYVGQVSSRFDRMGSASAGGLPFSVPGEPARSRSMPTIIGVLVLAGEFEQKAAKNMENEFRPSLSVKRRTLSKFYPS